MTDTLDAGTRPAVRRSRAAVLKRLADVVCLPFDRAGAFERSVAVDLLVRSLGQATLDERRRLAVRLSSLAEPPSHLVRPLLRDEPEVARVLLEEAASLSEADLIDCIRRAGPEHRLLAAARRTLGEAAIEALIEAGENASRRTLLFNDQIAIGVAGLEILTQAAMDDVELIPLLLDRRELQPAQAYRLFWPADAAGRRLILRRFAVSRELLRQAVGDLYAVAKAEDWADQLSHGALQFIGRRQRDRSRVGRYPDLEAAVAAAAGGLTRDVAAEIVRLAGIKPHLGARILADDGGEPLAVLCKAAGLSRPALAQLWRAQGRDEKSLDSLCVLFDTLAVEGAQTVIRYWEEAGLNVV